MNTQKLRNGLSVLEFIGCTMALVGGVWLGAIYLGVDIQHLAYVALSESKLMDQVPEKWRPVDKDAENAPTQAELAASVKNELVSLRQEIASLGQTDEAQPSAAPATQPGAAVSNGDSAERTPKQATVEYWKQLSEIIQNNAALQVNAESAATEGNATKVAALKGRISRLSATAIHALPTKQVDSQLVTFAKELAAWYESGATLYDEAVQVWGAAAKAAGSSQLTKEWERAHAQFNNEGRLLRGRAVAVREALTQQSGVEFPPLSGL